MKRIFKGILALTLIAVLLTGAALAASGKVTTTGSDLKMRSGPGTKFIIINAIAKKNTTVSYSDYTSSNGGWYYVSYNGDRGWISAAYAKEQGSGGGSGSIRMTGNSYQRKVPDPDGDILTTAHKGEEYEYTDVEYDDRGVAWYYIKIAGRYGWVSSKYTEEIGPSGDYLYATGDTNIRKSANKESKSYGTMKKGTYALYLDDYEYDERGVVWYYVNYNGTKGWVSSKYTEF